MNVRGLNDPVKRDTVRVFVDSVKVNLVVLQETKLEVVDSFLVMQCLGPVFDGFAFLPAQETCGGVLVAWDSAVLSLEHISFDSFSVNAEVKMAGDASSRAAVMAEAVADTRAVIPSQDRGISCKGNQVARLPRMIRLVIGTRTTMEVVVALGMPVVLATEGLEIFTEVLDMVSTLVDLTISIIARARISKGISHLLEVPEEGLFRIVEVSMEFVEREA
jgi:hypothetical protein